MNAPNDVPARILVVTGSSPQCIKLITLASALNPQENRKIYGFLTAVESFAETAQTDTTNIKSNIKDFLTITKLIQPYKITNIGRDNNINPCRQLRFMPFRAFLITNQ